MQYSKSSKFVFVEISIYCFLYSFQYHCMEKLSAAEKNLSKTPVKVILHKCCVTCRTSSIQTRLIKIFGNKARRESFVENLKKSLGIDYSSFEKQNVDQIYACEICYKTVLNYMQSSRKMHF